MESQPQNPEFRINPENFHPCVSGALVSNSQFFMKSRVIFIENIQRNYLSTKCTFDK